jgi:hypothetical protein
MRPSRWAAALARKSLGHRPRVQHMADRRALNQRRSRKPGALLPLIGSHGIDDICLQAGRPRELKGQQRAEIRSMLTTRRPVQFFHHCVIHEKCSATDRRQQPASPSYCSHFTGRIILLIQGLGNHGRTVFETRHHRPVAKSTQLLIAVAHGSHPGGSLPRIQSELGRCRSRIDRQNAAALFYQEAPRNLIQAPVSLIHPKCRAL